MPNEQTTNPNLILSPGTYVVTLTTIYNQNGDVLYPAGAVGVIVKSPLDNDHAYRVKFPNGAEKALKRREFAIQKHYRRDGMQREPQTDLYQYVIYRCVVGSRAYGLDHDESDVDVRGIYLPPADLHWSLYGVPEQLERGEEAYWEIQKFISLALKANPNILECLYTPLVEHADPLARELLDMRDMFLTKLVYQTYNGYVMSQFKKMVTHERNHGKIKWKHAMHLIRLLLSGITVLREGFVPVQVDAYRERLLAIRREEVAWDDVDRWRRALHDEFDAAFQTTQLPDRPDYAAANDFLVKARRSMI